ncbi:MAG: hypothetical protein ACLTAI_01275 [Thomasclavelia sp.]
MEKEARKLSDAVKTGKEITGISKNQQSKRSMLYVENLCEFVRLVISNNNQGIYYPQNSEYASTTAIVKTVNPKIKISGILKPGVFISSKVPGKISGLCNKAFGNLVYEKSMSQYSENYCRYDLKSQFVERRDCNEKAIIIASVASMIDQFNRDNINLLQELGYRVSVACNFEYGSSTSNEQVRINQ